MRRNYPAEAQSRSRRRPAYADSNSVDPGPSQSAGTLEGPARSRAGCITMGIVFLVVLLLALVVAIMAQFFGRVNVDVEESAAAPGVPDHLNDLEIRGAKGMGTM